MTVLSKSLKINIYKTHNSGFSQSFLQKKNINKYIYKFTATKYFTACNILFFPNLMF